MKGDEMKKSMIGVLGLGIATAAVALTFTLQGALNQLTGSPTATTYTTQEALNILAVGHADSLRQYTAQAAANYIVNHGARLAIPEARTNTAPVRFNGAWTSMNTTANTTAGAGVTTREFFCWAHTAKISRTAPCVGWRIYVAHTTAYDSIIVKMWNQRNGVRYDLKNAKSFRIARTSLTPGINTITLATPVTLQRGWGYSITIKKQPANAPASLLAFPAYTNAITTNVVDTEPIPVGHLWMSEPSYGTGQYLAEVEFLTNELVQGVVIGYSQMEGHDSGSSSYHSFAHDITFGTDTSTVANQVTPWTYHFSTTLRPGVTLLNMGIGGQTAAQIIARSSAHVFSQKPRFAVVQMGGADTDSASVYNSMNTFLDSCSARVILPVVVGLAPATAKTNEEMFRYDRMNVSLANLCATHAAGAIFVNVAGTMGQTTTTGTPTPPLGNLWDILAAHDSGDGLHYDANSGQLAFGTAINNALKFDFTRP